MEQQEEKDKLKTGELKRKTHTETDFNLVGKTLTAAVFPAEDAKTGKNIRRELVWLLVNTFGLEQSSLSRIVWVTNQGSNIVKALEPYKRISCLDHVINTVLRHGLDKDALSENAPDIGETITAVKSVVRFTKQSGLAAQLSKTVLQMGETRFSTIYLTLKSVREIYTELFALFLWPTFNKLKMMTPTEVSEVHVHVRTLLEEDGGEANPRPTTVENEMDEAHTSSTLSPPAAKRKISLFAEWENADEDDDAPVRDEVSMYISQRHAMDDDRDLLGWWRTNSCIYPRLAKLARSVLCIPASSSSSERVFSAASRTIDQRRTSLKPGTVDAILFLHDDHRILSEEGHLKVEMAAKSVSQEELESLLADLNGQYRSAEELMLNPRNKEILQSIK
uniref:uncharacterized protein LOC120335369 n=1 Tax=Styela clava TaxID=7725 RepID=UPI0019395858|nr:uncharacterized protein LOC120335369 [Styela clava]